MLVVGSTQLAVRVPLKAMPFTSHYSNFLSIFLLCGGTLMVREN